MCNMQHICYKNTFLRIKEEIKTINQILLVWVTQVFEVGPENLGHAQSPFSVKMFHVTLFMCIVFRNILMPFFTHDSRQSTRSVPFIIATVPLAIVGYQKENRKMHIHFVYWCLTSSDAQVHKAQLVYD